jgi:hypothetical protein
MKRANLSVAAAAAIALVAGAASAAVAAGKDMDGMAQWCTNDKAAASKDVIYDADCPGAKVKRNADGTWGDAPSDMGTPGDQDMNETPQGGQPGAEGMGGPKATGAGTY